MFCVLWFLPFFLYVFFLVTGSFWFASKKKVFLLEFLLGHFSSMHSLVLGLVWESLAHQRSPRRSPPLSLSSRMLFFPSPSCGFSKAPRRALSFEIEFKSVCELIYPTFMSISSPLTLSKFFSLNKFCNHGKIVFRKVSAVDLFPFFINHENGAESSPLYPVEDLFLLIAFAGCVFLFIEIYSQGLFLISSLLFKF